MNELEDNLEKLQELQPQVLWAAERWVKQCFEYNLMFKVLEVYRPQERQDELYSRGRWKTGKKVTWTLNSLHTKRLACDIEVINCTYQQVEAVGAEYGITRPLAGKPYYDEGHFQFDNVGGFPIILRGQYKLRALKRSLKRVSGQAKVMVKNTIRRLLMRTSRADD